MLHVPAGRLSHGEKRALELAIALAMEPKVLLLDEPMAGTGREESARLVDVLRRLKGRFPVLLVEHDMTAVFALADRISVLDLRTHSRKRRHLRKCGPIRASLRPISATRWSEAGCSSVDHLQAAYGPAQVLFDICFPGRALVRSSHCSAAMGWERPPPLHTHHGPLDRPAAAASVFEGRSLVGLPPYRIAQAGLGLVPEGRQVFPARSPSRRT